MVLKYNSRITCFAKCFIDGHSCVLAGAANGTVTAWTCSGSSAFFSQQLNFNDPYSNDLKCNGVEISQMTSFSANQYVIISSRNSGFALIS